MVSGMNNSGFCGCGASEGNPWGEKRKKKGPQMVGGNPCSGWGEVAFPGGLQSGGGS